MSLVELKGGVLKPEWLEKYHEERGLTLKAVLIVDAEGFVERVLGYSPLPTPLPQLVLFEHVYLSEPQRARIDANLLGQGFHRIADLRHMDARGANAPPQDRLYGRLRIKPQ